MPVVVAFDISEQRLPCVGLRRPTALMDEFDLGAWKKLSIGALSQQFPVRLMEGVAPITARC